MPAPRTPVGLDVGGRSLWRNITADHSLDAAQKVQLLEACRAKDRLDKLDDILRGESDVWMTVEANEREGTIQVVVDKALDKANATANLMKMMLAAIRIPDAATGKIPQYRGPRGVQQPTGPRSSKVTAMDRAARAG